jgi:von Willebrand factor type A domain
LQEQSFVSLMLRRLSKTIVRVVFTLGALVGVASASAANVDVRILIDVSGSMRENDPANLRIPAVRLVAELMPRGANAGIWMFSETVDQLIVPRNVDAEWKAAALEATNKIHSHGQFTDIELALAAATGDWSTTGATAAKRHVILLTDGMVDVSKRAADSEVSRNRLLGDGLTRIKALGAQVHTIALSTNSDRGLLTTLAESTEGWAEQVDDAASLQRVFLHMFEQAASPDSIPLLDNRFDVDGSISEMTLLVFRGKSADPLQLITPAGDRLDERSHPAGVNWRAESGYDLVTVGSPETGAWQLNTDPDPDNRVLIVTDLKLVVDTMPTNVLADESLVINANITEHDAPLVREDFLKLLQAELVVSGAASAETTVSPLVLDPQQARFTGERSIDWPPGDYEFVVRVDGGTFRREQRSRLRIHGAPVTFSNTVSNDGRSLEFSARAEADLVAPNSLMGMVFVAKPDGSSEVFDLPAFSNNETSLVISAPLNGVYRIEPRLLGRAASGRILNIKAVPLMAEITAGADPVIPDPEPEIEPVVLPPIDWLRSGAVVMIGNVVVAMLLGVVWLLLGQRRHIPSSQVVLQ